jgi:hypothetical protein
VSGRTESDDILKFLREMLEITSLVLIENHKVHINAALTQEVVREKEILSDSSLSRIVDLKEYDRKIS